ncbi:HD domain-containing protein [Nocardia sp. NPDC006044]|uniref:HD domain-containing protein n=1 Tax=Nocardia sp. NPDC006044 TaxID=3364306 RepID=UPI0036BC5260
MSDPVETVVQERLSPWTGALGKDLELYTNHVLRVLSLCDLLALGAGEPAPSSRAEYLTAAVFHDLGVWTAGTFDYLEPSERLAEQWLTAHDGGAQIPLVIAMIDEHHRIRAARDPRPQVEIFRRADTIDATAGARRFGVSRRDYRAIVRRYPSAGFYRRLARLAADRARAHPLSPLPMVKW